MGFPFLVQCTVQISKGCDIMSHELVVMDHCLIAANNLKIIKYGKICLVPVNCHQSLPYYTSNSYIPVCI